MKYYNSKARQAGMTLIELTVVLLVLIGLAGLLIPYVGGFVKKTHDSVNSDSLFAVNNAIQRYDVQFMGHPSNYDSLMTAMPTTADANNTNIYTKMMGGLGTNDYLKEVAIQGSAFTGIGISSLRLMDNNTTDATFKATNATQTLLPTTNYAFAALNVKGSACVMGDAMGCIPTDAELSKILGRTVDTQANDYVVFGVGQDTAMIGKTISEAPVHFAQKGSMSAKHYYNRILAVYQVPKKSTCLADGNGITEYWDGTAAVQITNETTCLAAAGTNLVDNTDPANPAAGAAITNTVWTGNMQQPAKFLTTLMPMMKVEGLGGALASHYASVDG